MTTDPTLAEIPAGLDGLFHVVADEEKKIRTDPRARVTDLLRDVFAQSHK